MNIFYHYSIIAVAVIMTFLIIAALRPNVSCYDDQEQLVDRGTLLILSTADWRSFFASIETIPGTNAVDQERTA